MGAIFRREMGAFFSSAIAYIFLGVFFEISGFFNLFVKYPEIGFEASNHYYYTERNFIEKLINIKYNFIN